jgi:hypothetical protein
MTNYIMIDNASGYVWGDAVASNPTEACAKMDVSFGVYGREYEERARSDFANENGYFVYDGTDFDMSAIAGGTEDAAITAVAALPLVAYVRVIEVVQE